MNGFTRQDGLALARLLSTLIIMTIVLWVAVRLFTPLEPAFDDVYVASALLPLLFHLIRSHTRATRRRRQENS